MKTLIRSTVSLIILLAFFAVPQKAVADEDPRRVIILGHVTTQMYGNPLKDHKITITTDPESTSQFEYFKEIYTDEDGYFYDTIYTTVNDGSLIVFTHDRFGLKYDTTVYFRFSTEDFDNDPDNDNIFITDFSLYMESQKPVLQANFSYELAITTNKFLFNFIDETECDELISWEWDFGDGKTSNEQNPQHLFPEAGIYKVQLKVTGIVNGKEVTNTVFKYIFISKFDYYHIGGHAYGEPPMPIDVGLAYLYHQDDEKMVVPIDTAKIDTFGYYYFYQIPEGHYTVKVQVLKSSESYGILLPTYYGDVIYWQEAEFFFLDDTNWEYHVYMLEGMGMSNGDGKISGAVTDGFNIGGYSSATSGIDVYLLNEDGDVMTSHYTDYYSEFVFEGIALDTYYITPEITGIANDKKKIELNEDKPQENSITINVFTGEVVLGIGDHQFLTEGVVSNPYPNPAGSYVNINITAETAGQTAIEVVDLQGRLLFSNDQQIYSGVNKFSIETSDFENGIYIIRVQTENQITDRKFIVNR